MNSHDKQRVTWHVFPCHDTIILLHYICANSLATAGFPSQRASNVECVFMSWHHHLCCHFTFKPLSFCLLKDSPHKGPVMWNVCPHVMTSSLCCYNKVIINAMASQITGISIVCTIVGTGPDQRKHQSSASLAFCAGNSPVTGEFPTQKASNVENISICWRYHALHHYHYILCRLSTTWLCAGCTWGASRRPYPP